MTPPTWAAGLHHDGSPRYVAPGPYQIGQPVTIRLRCGRGAPIQQILLRSCPDGEQILTPMRAVESDDICQWWEGQLPVGAPMVSYRFSIRTEHGTWWLTAHGLTRHTPTDAHNFRILANHRPPSWMEDAVFYQIFPDRFADGEPSNNLSSGAYLYDGRPVQARAWGELPRRADGPIEFFGGDLQGIARNLSAIADLGASAIYLNPIFTAPSNHKYDVADYMAVDPHLGGEEGLLELRRALDAYGMRVILDIVPNHCGATHHWFHAAQADPESPEASFFSFTRHPDEYEAWFGIRSLPKLDYRSEELRQRMYAAPDSIMRHWLQPPYRIDGWRIDVANMLARQGDSQLGHKIGRGLRRAIKRDFPEAYLVGENFYDGSPQLQGNELDATMNYSGFTLPLWEWLAGIDIVAVQLGLPPGALLPTAALAEQWRAYMATIPWQVARQQYNLLGSHDTPRILTTLGEDRALLRLATVLLFTFPGVPSIYYGDEIGMLGGGDPDCRRCMIWDRAQWDHELREHYRALTRLRRSAAALREGGFQILHAAGETIAYQREARGERMIVVARRSPDDLEDLDVAPAGVPDGARLRELLSGSEMRVAGGRLPLAGLGAPGAQIWRWEG
jgi:alpha-glucosidase